MSPTAVAAQLGADAELVAVIVTTTTIFPDGTAGVTVSSINTNTHDDEVPIAAIVGGILAGATLAVLSVVGWIFWGRQILKAKRKRMAEDEKIRKTTFNTIQNRMLARPPSTSRMRKASFLQYSGVRKVQFAFSTTQDESDSSEGVLKPSTHLEKPAELEKHSTVITFNPAGADKPQMSTRNQPSLPKPARTKKDNPGRRHSNNISSPIRYAPRNPSSLQPRSSFNPSILSSQSTYSVQSGDERQKYSNLAKAALGKVGPDDSRWSSVTKVSSTSGSSGRGRRNRLSHASSGSALSVPSDQMGVPIGVAYGGE